MKRASDWRDRVGRVWADHYAVTDRTFAGLTQILVERLVLIPGEVICDIGCGAGELALELARARPYAQVLGLDISQDLIAAARQRGAGQVNARFAPGDAAQWQAEAGHRPDLYVSRHGVMFFDNPVAAFAHLHAEAAPEAHLLFSCFRGAQGNPWASEASALLDAPPPPDPYAPGPFAFAEEEHVRSLLLRSGWRDVVMEPVDFAFVTGAGADPVGDSLKYFTRIGPAADAFHQDEDENRQAELVARLKLWLQRYRNGDCVVFPAQAWIVSARKRD